MFRDMSHMSAINDLQRQLDALKAKAVTSPPLSSASSSDWCGERMLNCGKYRGVCYSEICKNDYQYCGWVLNNRDISSEMYPPSGSMADFKSYLVAKLRE